MSRAKALFLFLSPRRTNTMSTQQQIQQQINHLQAALWLEMDVIRALDNVSSDRADRLSKEIDQLKMEMHTLQVAAEEAAYKREEMRLFNLKLAKCCSVVGCVTLLLCSWGVLRSWGVHQLANHSGDMPTVVDISK
jgi:hypothetical protein